MEKDFEGFVQELAQYFTSKNAVPVEQARIRTTDIQRLAEKHGLEDYFP